MRNRNRLTAVLCACAGLACQASAQSWTNAAGGNFQTGSNWSPVGVPAINSRPTFGLNNAYTVSFTAPTRTAGFGVSAGQVTFNLQGFAYELTGNTSVTV
jgi:hypothetical protein